MDKKDNERMQEIMQRIKKRRNTLELSYEALSEKTGISKSTLQRYETGFIKNMPLDKIEVIAEALHTSPSYLMGWNEDQPIKPRKKGVAINVYGNVAAGIPLEMIEDIIDTEEIPEEMARSGTFFGLRIKGDSMEPKILDGDVVIVRQQSDAESGETVIATINGDSATCKRLKKYGEGIALISINPKYEPMYFSNKEALDKPVRILGKVVELRRKL